MQEARPYAERVSNYLTDPATDPAYALRRGHNPPSSLVLNGPAATQGTMSKALPSFGGP